MLFEQTDDNEEISQLQLDSLNKLLILSKKFIKRIIFIIEKYFNLQSLISSDSLI